MSINILLIIVVLAVLFKIAEGYKRGVVKEISSLISLIVVCILMALIAGGVRSYLDGNIVRVIVMVVLAVVLAIANHLVKFALFPAKLLSKLPLISFVDKILGAIFGVLEVILLLWTVYTLVMMFYMGSVGDFIISNTQSSMILSWFYEHNYLAYLIEKLVGQFPTIN